MKILGVGVDLVINKRVQLLIKNKNFLKELLDLMNLNFQKKKMNKTNYFAKRFAAKEALSKSIGTGLRDGLYFKNIEILNDKMGKPYFYKSRKLDQFVKKKFKIKKYDLFLSLSDEKDHSIAFTILIKRS